MLGAVSDLAFQALSDPHRRTILRLVRTDPRSVSELADHFEISQQAVSQHLQVLKRAGLVAVRADGQRRLYRVRTDGLESVRQFLSEFWPAALEDLKRTVESDERA